MGEGLMKTLYCLNNTKNELQEVMTREVMIMRNLLTSLQDEHNAIIQANEKIFEDIMEERIQIVSSFEQWSEKLIFITIKLAEELGVVLSNNLNLRHSEAIEILETCLALDDFELVYLRTQIETLIEEIHYQNNINAQLIQNKTTFSYRIFQKKQEVHQIAKAKITLAVLDR